MRFPPGTRKRCMLCHHIAAVGMKPVVRIDKMFIGWRCCSATACRRRIWGGCGKQVLYGPRSGQFITTPMDPATHGTAAGARAHYRRGEKPCEPCLKAARVYDRERAEARKKGDRNG